MDIIEIEAAIEAMLFASGDALPLDKLAEAVEIDKKTLRAILTALSDKYQAAGRGLILREIDGSYQLCTKQIYHEYIKRLFEPRQKQGLSQAAFETLSIIAYKQPVTRAKIEAIRGVNSDSAVSKLLDRNLIKEAGRLDAPGKPILYATTDEFLRSFGFKSPGDLPVLSMNDTVIEEEIQETV